MVADSAGKHDVSSIEALFKNFARLGRDGLTTLLVPWLAIAVIDFGFVAISIVIVLAAGSADPTTGAGLAVQIVGFVQALAVLSLRVALLKVLRDVAFDGPRVGPDYGGVARSIGKRLVPSFLITVVVGAIVAVGTALCVLPGLIALFFLAFAPYLVAATDSSIGGAIRESTRWAQREWVLLLTALVVGVIAVGIMACAAGVAGGLGARPAIAVPAGLIGGWVVNTIIGYVAFLWWGAVYVTAESRMQVESFRKTAPGGGSPGGYEGYDRPMDEPDTGSGGGARIYGPGYDEPSGPESS